MKLCVFLGANAGRNDYSSVIKQLSENIVKHNSTLIYGGANEGLMGILANSVLNLSGKVLGVMPTLGLSAESAHKGLTELIFVPNIEDRKQKMLELSDAFIALPGGLGTLEEILKVWNAIKLGQITRPLIILNIDNYYQYLFEQINRASTDGFLHDKFRSLVHIVESVPHLFEILTKHRNEKETTIVA